MCRCWERSQRCWPAAWCGRGWPPGWPCVGRCSARSEMCDLKRGQARIDRDEHGSRKGSRRQRMLKMISTVVAMGGIGFSLVAGETKPLFENNFEKENLDAVPEGFLVIDGGFA